jgi:hypothetical protein
MIKTRAAFGVGIRALNEVILSNNLQISDFFNRVESGRFAGFSGEGNRQSEPDLG